MIGRIFVSSFAAALLLPAAFVALSARAELAGHAWQNDAAAQRSTDQEGVPAPASQPETPAAEALDPADIARVRAYERARIEVVDRLSPTVVCMFNRGNRAGGGSGVVIDPEGYGLTNFHVVASMMAERVGEGGLSDGRTYPFDVLGIDPTGDVAMFRFSGGRGGPTGGRATRADDESGESDKDDESDEDRAPPAGDKPADPSRSGWAFAELGDSDALRLGDYTLAMGNPFLLAEDYTPTVTLGIVSGLHRYQWGAGRALRYTDCIQVDTSINPGNSGGPLFDLGGRLVGINGRVSIEERGRVNVGVGYAISINQIKMFIPALRAGLPTKHATAGFTVVDREAGVVVNQILDDSDAYRKGLRLGDAILRFGGKDISSANQFTSLLGIYPGRWPVEVSYRRGDRVEQVMFRLEDLPFPKMPRSPAAGAPDAPAMPDLFASHRVTDAANARSVARALRLYGASLGGRSALSAVRTIRGAGTRRFVRRPADEAQPIELAEARPEENEPRSAENPAALEREIRWALLAAAARGESRSYKVVGGDEVRGRIAVVLEWSRGPAAHRCSFDDANGQLLRVEFHDANTNQTVRYEYGDYRRTDGLRLPHRRWLYLGDEPYAEDEFREMRGSTKAS